LWSVEKEVDSPESETSKRMELDIISVWAHLGGSGQVEGDVTRSTLRGQSEKAWQVWEAYVPVGKLPWDIAAERMPRAVGAKEWFDGSASSIAKHLLPAKLRALLLAQPQKSRLVLVPDAALAALPWAALPLSWEPVGCHEPFDILGEQVRLEHLPLSRLLAADPWTLEAAPDSDRTRASRPALPIVIAAFYPGRADSGSRGLDGAQRERAVLRGLQARGEIHLVEVRTAEALLDALRKEDAEMLVLSCHGSPDPGLAFGFELAPSEWITLGQLAVLTRLPRQVVASICFSGALTHRDPTSVVAVCLSKGTELVIAGTWDLVDGPTEQIMLEHHRLISAHDVLPGDRLDLALAAYRATSPKAHPGAWASLTVTVCATPPRSK
jgi:hypothetical protein